MSDVPPNTETTPPPIEPTPPVEPTTEASLLTETKVETPPVAFDAEKIEFPEGLEKNEYFDKFTELAKTEGLSQDTAQKLMGLYGEALKFANKAITDPWIAQNEKWVAEAKADPEFGGDKFDGMRTTIAKALDDPALSDPKFREALDMTGAGNNPAVIRTLYRWATRLTEGGSVAGNPPPRDAQGNVGGRPDAATAIYGDSGPRNTPFRN